ncbi:MAG: Mur ligase family protein, partial [Methanobacteriaceae archaeon]
MASKVRNKLATSLGKVALAALKVTGREGTALPGKVALKVQANILNELSSRCKKIVLITGTNGKTTTNNLINHILNGKYDNIASNLKGANMIQGVTSSFIINPKKSYDWGIFEVDEGSFEDVVKQISPDYVILTNFFRDQLDRYGEIENTIKMVYNSLKGKDFTLIVNTDDPSTIQFNELSNKKENPNATVDYIYYGVSDNTFSDNENSIAEG